ncbi:hypothetical protein A3D80_00470 [Candidatus Roizmanbacteria bacterium RIFCSPHIGHO2_02_FULL_40_13b]|uniref:Membrane insertase YidC/Oxa/ALB C-terminal domain-containing protein n=1 Tax=Candidatus Roizmanbacteria bacterium RIFCSPHIGHO2_01_FULL_39_24 TaxID=1802032 RepID=A0A1F7GLC8_9BACT|nr:MAG: hypothetical protein A2799_02435 [Candidatus Roizmanbacteria bacterium RIFCSPHIGHO2_01_FULL_39_24]OGK27421.1 MAG: hypothetical protein A3D80_00470 [Candidatus Roizmanbacteria bacterium RIFCSPHIGHO2_02_FULL_40_13b]OGK50434.1 MAG: hypothetical protein A3A56_02280 [Candidatus Roizmanbacteria bacterium RIFCSPLOWO2_01_FULL_40_32]OGK56391.1 MAG: hypothetical protein A3H83_01080 [Candidatus Roizmanbacteria bacterium RIFCSPLOWO2_02_FULL_39_8]
MDLTSGLFNAILIVPTINVLLFFNFIFSAIGLPGSFGFSIIALTVAIRLLLNPASRQQIDMAKKMQEMKPHLDILGEKHKDDKKKLQEEQMKLYKEMGVNPAAGCLYALVQIPVFIGLYQALNIFLAGEPITKVAVAVNKIVYIPFLKIATIDPWFFGFNIGIAPSNFPKYGLHYLAIPVITAILQYYQVKVTMSQTPPKPKKEGEKSTDMQSMMSGQMLYIFPLMIGYFAYVLPAGLSLYWNVFSIFSIIQYKGNPLKSLLVKIPKK